MFKVKELIGKEALDHLIETGVIQNYDRYGKTLVLKLKDGSYLNIDCYPTDCGDSADMDITLTAG